MKTYTVCLKRTITEAFRVTAETKEQAIASAKEGKETSVYSETDTSERVEEDRQSAAAT